MRVLLVEDEADVAQPIARALKYAGHQVTIAHDGREALLLVMGATPDVILLDLRMPKMDGITFLGIVRSYLRLADVPVFVVTALADDDAEFEQALQHDVQRVFRKGKYSLDDLLSAVADVQPHL